MSNLTEVSNALAKMESELTSLQEAVDAIDIARESTTDAVEFAVTLNNSAEELINKVRTLTENIKDLSVVTRFDNLESSSHSLETGIDELASQLQQIGQEIQSLGLGPKIENIEASAFLMKVGVENLNLQLQLMEKNHQEAIKSSSSATNNKVEELGIKVFKELFTVKIVSVIAALLAIIIIVIVLLT